MSMNASECILSMYVNVHEFILYINVYECIWLWMNVYERIWRFWWHGNTGVYRQASQVGSFHQHKWMVSPTVSILASEDGYVLLWRIRGSSPITKTSLEVTMKNLGTLQSWSIFPYISNIWSISIHFHPFPLLSQWFQLVMQPLGWLGSPGFLGRPRCWVCCWPATPWVFWCSFRLSAPMRCQQEQPPIFPRHLEPKKNPVDDERCTLSQHESWNSWNHEFSSHHFFDPELRLLGFWGFYIFFSMVSIEIPIGPWCCFNTATSSCPMSSMPPFVTAWGTPLREPRWTSDLPNLADVFCICIILYLVVSNHSNLVYSNII